MSDPNYTPDDGPPPQPPRPGQPKSQLEQDELYARQLAAHYQSSTPHGYGSRTRGDPPLPRQRKETGLNPNELSPDRSFFDGW
jgi:hypothetical protein